MNPLDHIGWQGTQLLLGIELFEQSDYARIGLFRQKKGTLFLEKSWVVDDPKALQQSLKKYALLPFFVSLNSENIIERCIPQEKDPISAVLGVKVDNRKDFYIQQIPCGNYQWTALIRKTLLEEMLEPLAAFRDRLIYINISKVPQVFLLPAMSDYQASQPYLLENYIAWQGKLLPENQLNNALEKDFASDELARQLQLEEDSLQLYAAAIYFFIAQGEDVGSISFLEKNRKQVRQETIWTRVLTWVSLGILLLAIGGMLAKMFINQRMQADMLVAQQHAAELKLIDEQAEKINKQHDFLKKASSKTLKSSRHSLYADRILSACPEDIYLDRLILHPTKKDINQLDVESSEKSKDVLIQGLSKSSSSLAVFAQDLQVLKQINQVDLLFSEYDMKAEVYRFVMELKLAP